MTLRFSDGMSLMRGGPINLIRLGGRWYVVGRGYLCAVESETEGTELILLLKTARENNESPCDHRLDAVSR